MKIIHKPDGSIRIETVLEDWERTIAPAQTTFVKRPEPRLNNDGSEPMHRGR